MRARRSVPVATIAAVVALLGVVPPAGADVVMSHRTACPTGSRGDVSHTGPWCKPATCQADTDCDNFFDSDRTDSNVKPPKEAMACVEYPLCVRVETVTQRGGWAGGQKFDKSVVDGACDAHGGCPGQGSCSRAKHCIPKRLVGVAPTAIPGTGAPPTSAPPTRTPPTPGGPAPTPTDSPPTPGAGAPGDAPSAPVAPSSCGRCAAGGGPQGGGTMAGLIGAAIALFTTRRLRAPGRQAPARSRRSSPAPRSRA
ncbi:MAG: hypothetical protein WKG00_18475 [Polyangiaceae bacterium]